MGEKTSDQATRPWWVRMAIPVASANRRVVVRNTIVMSVLFGISGATMIARAFIEGGDLHPYRWWVLAFFALVAVGMSSEFKAIRWTDRAGLWQREGEKGKQGQESNRGQGEPNHPPHQTDRP
jgi:hypothetical protein